MKRTDITYTAYKYRLSYMPNCRNNREDQRGVTGHKLGALAVMDYS